MEYPGSIITKPVRYTILITFIVLFFISAPILVMYTSGYRYDWKRGFLRETGALNIDIEPKNSTALINNIYIKEGMPLRLTNRMPGKYNIIISSPGYFDWQKEIEIKNKQTLYIKEISLLKNSQPILVTTEKADNLNITFDSKFIIYTRIANNKIEIHLLTTDANSDITLAVLSEEDGVKITTAPNHNYFVVADNKKPHNTLLIFNSNDLTKKIDLIARHRHPIIKYQWRETSSPELFYSTVDQLMSILPISEQRFILGKNIWHDWQMENGKLWSLQYSSTTEKIKIHRDTLGINEEFFPENYFTQTEQDINILFANNNNLLLKKAGQSEMIIATKNKKYNIAGDKYKISNYNNWWLIWTPWELWAYSIGEEPNLLNRSGEGLSNVEPLDKYNTLALIWEDKMTALYPYYLVTHNLIDTKINSMVTDTKNKKIYFSANINNQEGIWSINY